MNRIIRIFCSTSYPVHLVNPEATKIKKLGGDGEVDFADDRFQVTLKDPVQFTPRGPLPRKNRQVIEIVLFQSIHRPALNPSFLADQEYWGLVFSPALVK